MIDEALEQSANLNVKEYKLDRVFQRKYMEYHDIFEYVSVDRESDRSGV